MWVNIYPIRGIFFSDVKFLMKENRCFFQVYLRAEWKMLGCLSGDLEFFFLFFFKYWSEILQEISRKFYVAELDFLGEKLQQFCYVVIFCMVCFTQAVICTFFIFLLIYCFFFSISIYLSFEICQRSSFVCFLILNSASLLTYSHSCEYSVRSYELYFCSLKKKVCK